MNRRSLTRAVLTTALCALGRGAIAERATGATPQALIGRDLLARIRALLESLQAPRLGAFLSEWPHEAPARSVTPSTLPVLKYLPALAARAPAWAGGVADPLSRGSSQLFWGQSYPAAVVGAAFLENYGWTEIAGLHGPVPSEHVAAGFLVLGPATSYPRHRHEAEEIYVPLSGTGAWQNGSGEWRDEAPGSVIIHERNEPHAMRTSSAPILALYLWRSENLDQKSRIDAEG